MLLGKIIGTVVASKKEPELEGLRMLLVRELDPDLAPTGKIIVAVDAVNAGIGEVILFASGSSARQTAVTNNRPVDHVIMAVVDTVDIGGKSVYDKANASD